MDRIEGSVIIENVARKRKTAARSKRNKQKKRNMPKPYTKRTRKAREEKADNMVRGI